MKWIGITILLCACVLTPAFSAQSDTVRGLHVRGKYPILDKNIIKLIPLQPGSVFNEKLALETISAIQEYLTRQGYYDSRVKLRIKKIRKYPDVADIVITIKKRRTYRVGKIHVSGNRVVSAKKIKNKISRFLRFRQIRFKKDLKKIKKMYAKKNYIKARVKVEKLEFNDQTRKVDIYLSVRENKKLKIKIAGKPFFSKGRLKTVTGLGKRRSYDRYAIKNGEYRLERYYRKKGYPQVSVGAEMIKPDKENVIAKYTIVPGTRVELKKIKFRDRKRISNKKLKQRLHSKESGLFARSFFDQNLLSRDRANILALYREQGFFDARVSEPEIITNQYGDQKKVIFYISEGKPYTVAEIRIVPDQAVPVQELLKKIPVKTNKTFEQKKVAEAKDRILDLLQQEGFAYALVRDELIRNETAKTADVIFHIERGIKVFVGAIRISGHLITKTNTIRKNLKIREGDVFHYQKMLDAQLNLRKLGVFNSVQITPEGFENKRDRIDIAVTVIERKSVHVKVQGGYDSRHLVTGEFSFTKLNLFGSARQFNTRLIGGPKFDRAEMTFFSPRVFGASWNLANQYFYQYEDEPNFVSSSYGGFVNTLKNFGPHWTFGFKEQISHTELFEAKSNVAALGDSLFDNTFNELQLFGIFDTRDNYSDPHSGFYILARHELNTDLADVKNNFSTLELNISHHFGFFKRLVLVNTARFGHTFKLTSSPRIPANKLFFLGGADTLRGFSEDGVDPAGGTVVMIYNGELQLKVRDPFKVAGFLDVGFLGNDINAVATNDFREAAGVGLRYFTPIGPLRLDWGFLLDRRAGEPKSRVHFSFGYFF